MLTQFYRSLQIFTCNSLQIEGENKNNPWIMGPTECFRFIWTQKFRNAGVVINSIALITMAIIYSASSGFTTPTIVSTLLLILVYTITWAIIYSIITNFSGSELEKFENYFKNSKDIELNLDGDTMKIRGYYPLISTLAILRPRKILSEIPTNYRLNDAEFTNLGFRQKLKLKKAAVLASDLLAAKIQVEIVNSDPDAPEKTKTHLNEELSLQTETSLISINKLLKDIRVDQIAKAHKALSALQKNRRS